MGIIGGLLAALVAVKVIEQIPRAARLKPFPKTKRKSVFYESPFRTRRFR
jgi:hypothetical protein